MKYSIIVIGDELLIGQVIDTNSGTIARHLGDHGWELVSTQVIADRGTDICRAVDAAFAKCDCVITTGGLGPTNDDVTKSTLCSYFGGTLVHSTAVAESNERLFATRGLQMNRLTANQALVPDNCRVIVNPVGTAPVLWFERDRKVLLTLPGVPSEVRYLLDNVVTAALLERFPNSEHVLHRTLLVTGYSESALAEVLSDFEAQLPVNLHLAYLPEPRLIRLRLTGKSSDGEGLRISMQGMVSQLNDLLGTAIISHEDVPIAQLVGRLLQERGLTLATAESCSGGNIGHRITLVPGSSAYYQGGVISYQNEVKVSLLGVDAAVIDRYGVVSEPVVEQMAAGACAVLHTDCAIAVSGVAGPTGGTAEIPVGTVWTAVRCGERVETACLRFRGDRRNVIESTTTATLAMLAKMLLSINPKQ